MLSVYATLKIIFKQIIVDKYGEGGRKVRGRLVNLS